MVKFNSTIFRTIKDEATGANKSIGLFGKSFAELKNIISSVKTNGLFNASTISETDVECIKKYNNAIALNIPHQQAMEQATKGASDATAQMIKNANGNTIALDKMTLGAKAASVGLKALSVAGNMFLGMAISWGVSKLVEILDLIHTSAEETQEAFDELHSEFNDSKSAFEQITSEVESLESELESCSDKLKELQSLANVGSISIAELEELNLLKEQNDELERQIELKKAQQRIDATEALNAAKKVLDSEVKSQTYDDNHDTDTKTVYQEFDDAISEIELFEAWNKKEPGKYNNDISDLKTRVSEMYSYMEEYIKSYEDSIALGLELGYEETLEYQKALGYRDKYLTDFVYKNSPSQAFKHVQNYTQRGIVEDNLGEYFNNLESFDKWGVSSIDLSSIIAKSLSDDELVNLHSVDLPSIKTLIDEVNKKAFEYMATSSGNTFDTEQYQQVISDMFIELWRGAFVDTQEVVHEAKLEFSDIFNADSIDETKQKLLDLATSGELSVETITSTEEYMALLEQTSMSAQEFVDAIERFNIDNLQASFEKYEDVLNRVRSGQSLELEEITELINENDELAKAVIETGGAYSLEEDALISVLNQYIETSNIAISTQVEQTKQTISNIKERIKAYGIEEKAVNKFGKDIGNAFETLENIWNASHSKNALGQYLYDNFGMDATFLVPEIINMIESNAELDQLLKELEESFNNVNEYSKDGSSKSSSDTYFDWIEVKLENLNEELKKTKEQIADTFKWDVRDKALDKSITDTNILIEQQRLAMKRYMEEAKKSGLVQPYIDLIQQGKIDLLKLSNDDPLKEQIDSYQEWYEKAKECDEAITQLETDLDSLYDDKRTLKWEIFDYLEESISRITDEADHFIDLLSNKELFGDDGKLNEYGNATLGLHVSKLATYQQQAQDYAEEIKTLETMLATGGKEVLDKYDERIDKHREMISAYEQERQSILDLISDGYQAQIDALNDVIDKRREALQSEKDLYDYQQSIAEKTKNIATLEKRKLALSGDTSEEAKSQLQQIEVELSEARKDLEQTEYEKMISDTELMLDQLSADYEEWINERLDNSDALLEGIREEISTKGSTISNTLKEIAGKNDTFVSDELNKSITQGANTSINSYLNEIVKLLGGNTSFLGSAGGKGYATGVKRSKKEWAWTQENGVEIIRTKDGALLTPLDNSMVFNNESSKRLWEFAQNPSAFLNKLGLGNIIQPIINVASPKIPNVTKVSTPTVENNTTHMEVILPNVTNYDEFINRMQNDKRFDNIVTASMNSKMTGGNSLSKFRF